MITMVDRKSKYLLTMPSSSQKPAEVSQQMIRMFEELPREKLKTITLDHGMEFAHHTAVTQAIKEADFYFAHPMSPWERGLNENTNGLLRQYIPKRSYRSAYSEELLREFTRKLNLRPRKSLNWLSPFEVFWDSLLHFT